MRYHRVMETKDLATQIVHTLVDAGHIAYFAGGYVRDLVMGNSSCDIDIATSASPQEIVSLFPKTIQIGIAYGVVIVPLQGHNFEVATFRKDIEYLDGRKPSRIEPSTPEEDAKRRDFTINGLFYDPLTDTILDFVHGKKDIEGQIIRTIGNPYDRFYEDRLRMVRAIRFATRFNFHLDPETTKAIEENAPLLLPAVSMERIWQELKKMDGYPGFDKALLDMFKFGLLSTIFPSLKKAHLNDLKEQLLPLPQMPKETPTIIKVMELFPNRDAESIKRTCAYLKTSKKECDLALFLYEAENMDNPDRHSWALFYSHTFSELTVRIMGTKLPEKERKEFFAEHDKRRLALSHHIARLQEQTPVVTSAHLQQEGIAPSRKMGFLLKEAEKISILDEIIDPKAIIEKLKQTLHWNQDDQDNH